MNGPDPWDFDTDDWPDFGFVETMTDEEPVPKHKQFDDLLEDEKEIFGDDGL